MLPRAGADVDDPVGGHDGVLVVLDDEDRVPELAKDPRRFGRIDQRERAVVVHSGQRGGGLQRAPPAGCPCGRIASLKELAEGLPQLAGAAAPDHRGAHHQASEPERALFAFWLCLDPFERGQQVLVVGRGPPTLGASEHIGGLLEHSEEMVEMAFANERRFA